MSINSYVSKCILSASKGRLPLMYHKGICYLSGQGPGSFGSCALPSVLVPPSLVASTKMPPFPVLFLHMAGYKVGSKRSVDAKGIFLSVSSLFREGNFPKNSQELFLYIFSVRTGSDVSHWQRGIALS